MAARKTHHVTTNPSGGWMVKKAGANRASVRTETKSEAVKIGRVISQRSGTTLVVHGKDGKIQKRK